MSETRQERRRHEKKKMSCIHTIKQKGGKEIVVLNSRESERVDRIRQDPAFGGFRAVYEWLMHRPPPLGCDPEDLFPVPLFEAALPPSIPREDLRDIKPGTCSGTFQFRHGLLQEVPTMSEERVRCPGCGGVGRTEFPPGDIIKTKMCVQCDGTGTVYKRSRIDKSVGDI